MLVCRVHLFTFQQAVIEQGQDSSDVAALACPNVAETRRYVD